MAGEDILIVEDNASNLKLVNVLLNENNYHLHNARTAEEALALLETLQPQLILMDIQLPGMNGLILTKFLKTQGKYQHVPIIALTAYAMKEDEAKILAAGCDGYIAKPIDTRSFPSLIDQFLHFRNINQ